MSGNKVPDHIDTENPYVGPRTFSREQHKLFFGREQEARELLSVVLSERLTLFYAQSGAGKSSLLNTRLIPSLEARQFEVLPIGRVGGAGEVSAANPFVFNLMRSLTKRNEDVNRLHNLSLADFLARLTYTDEGYGYVADDRSEALLEQEARGENVTKNEQTSAVSPILTQGEIVPRILIIDQFEEILITHHHVWQARDSFFDQLAAAMDADSYLWVVLTMREDYVAGLDAYAHRLPNGLRHHYSMQRMEYEAALEAVKKPADLIGHRPFADGVAELLVDNLRRITVAGQGGVQLGQYIEPVQLQVVCYQLWENLSETRDVGEEPDQISLADLRQFGDVDSVLADFYEDALATVIQQIGNLATERQLRTWFSERLITESGTRGTVFQGPARTAGMPNNVVELLSRQFMIRTEIRAGGAWIELVHDRFIEPIRSANHKWKIKHDEWLPAAARIWDEGGRDESALLRGALLEEAERYAQERSTDLSQLDRTFIDHSLALAEREQQAMVAMQRREQEIALQAARRRATFLRIFAAIILLLATAATAFALRASQSTQRARWAEATAVGAGTSVAAQFATSQLAQATAVAAGTSVAAQFATSESRRWVAETAQAEIAGVFRDASAALTAQAALMATPVTSTTVDASVTPTPAGNVSPIITATNTAGDIPTVTPTPTPDLSARATVDAFQGQLVRAEATQKALDAIAQETAVALQATQTAVAPSGISIRMPFEDNWPMTQMFGANPEYYSQVLYDGVALKGHNGIDFGTPMNTPILATDDGKVLRVDFEANGFGHFILLEHEWGQSLYTHLERVDVVEGGLVRRSDPIVLSGNSGVSTGPYLHFGIRINPYSRTDGWGGFSDPLPYLELPTPVPTSTAIFILVPG